MKSFIHPENIDEAGVGKVAAERFAEAIATRYGYRPQDFLIVWDGGDFDASRDQHEMLVTSKDGRRASARIDGDALLRKDAWKYLREVDGAFAKLARRAVNRGL